MRRLILMRHAKSDWNHPGLSDHDRPLNIRGEKSAKVLGKWLRDTENTPDQVLCSSAQRTRQTLAGLQLPEGAQIEHARALYLAEAPAMLKALHAASGARVLMIGHNPGISELAHRLIDDPPAHERFEDYPTGATLICDFDVSDWNEIGWHQGQPINFVIPRELLADQ